MCGRYYIDSDIADEVEKVVYDIEQRVQQNHFAGDIFPTNVAPIIEKSEQRLKLDVIDKSALYAYAEDINQIIAVPTQRFTQIPGRSETKELILLRRALIKRIELLQNKKNKVVSNKINYVHFFSVLLGCKENQSINWRKQKSKYHLMVLDILQRFVDDGYINNYQVVKDNNRISGVKIF